MDRQLRRDASVDARTENGVAEAFGLGTGARFSSLPGGNIHDNFVVEGEGGRCVLQRLNASVFPDLGALTGNVERVVRHLENRRFPVPRIIRTGGGEASWEASDGSRWRAFAYVEGTEARSVVRDSEEAHRVAHAFGRFVVAVEDLPPPPLAEVLPRFHDLGHRMSLLAIAAAADRGDRRRLVRPELRKADDLASSVEPELASLLATLPRRIVHNDAKVANVLFDVSTRELRCVVDLDTVMPGSLLADVGELLRTAALRVPEDSGSRDVVDVDLDLFDAVTSGYLAGAAPVISSAEVDAVVLGGAWMSLENGVRFLTDFLDGDRYYKTLYSGHNLDRSRTQLLIAAAMIEHRAELTLRVRRAAAMRP